MLISFEGIDGSGKSTQIQLLKQKIEEQDLTVQVFREPGGTAVSEQIRELLLHPDSQINPVAEMLLFSSARSQLVSEKVLPALEKGEIVILDRFYDSTTAYQGYGRETIPLDQIDVINRIASHNRQPDITFYLRLSIEESLNRRKHMQKDRMEQSGSLFFKKVIQGFDELAKNEERFITIDALAEIEEIHLKILKEVSDRL